MENILVLLFGIGIGLVLFYGSLLVAILIQFISYKIFRFNIYKKVILPIIK